MFLFNKKAKFGSGQTGLSSIGQFSEKAGRNAVPTSIAIALLLLATAYISKNNAISVSDRNGAGSNLTVSDIQSTRVKEALNICLSERADGSPAIKRACIARISQRMDE